MEHLRLVTVPLQVKPNALAQAWTATRRLLPQRADVAAMRRDPKADLLAGLTVAVVALPLALAFGIASGVGAAAGLATAIVAGTLAAVFGGSNLQVSGPTGAMTVVLLPIIAQFGVSGVFITGIMAGVLLIALAYAGAGRAMRYIPLPVIEGFTVGIAVIIALQQVPNALGVHAEGERIVFVAFDAIGEWVSAPTYPSLLISIGVAFAMLAGARLRPRIPISLPAVIVATVIAAWLNLDVETIGAIPAGLPMPAFPAVDSLHQLQVLLLPAIAVAALAALESLLSATVADGMSVNEHHSPNRELFGQGIANLAAPLFGGVPATAAIARTAVNVRTGARSRLAAITHSVVLLIVVLAAAPLVGHIPLAALAGVLLATTVQMVQVSGLLALLRSTRGDALVLIATALATIIFDLVTAVIVGLVIASVFALSQLSRAARLNEMELETGDHSDEERALLAEHVIAYRLEGPLFFGAAHAFLMEVAEVRDVKVVILRLSRVQTLDATGASVLAETIRGLEHRGVTVLLSGVREEHWPIYSRLGVFDELAHEHHIFTSTPEAIAHAHTLLSPHA